MIVLALNSSSSTFKFGLYWVKASQSLEFLSDAIFASSPEKPLLVLSKLLAKSNVPVAAPVAVGHRNVHGEPASSQHCLTDDSVE